MNAHEAAALIAEAAQTMSATVYSPEQWGDRNSDAYAIVPSTGNGVVMVRTDDVIASWEMVAYVYRTTERVTTADDVMPALMADDGSSIDPVAEGLAPGGPDDNTADDIEQAIVDALGKADEHEGRLAIVAEVQAALGTQHGLTASLILTPDEEFTAVLVADASDVAVIVKDGATVAVESLTDDEARPEFATLSEAVAAILAHVDAL